MSLLWEFYSTYQELSDQSFVTEEFLSQEKEIFVNGNRTECFPPYLMSHSSDESTCNTRKRIKVLNLVSSEQKRRKNLFRFPDPTVGNSSSHVAGEHKMDWNNNDFLTRPFMC